MVRVYLTLFSCVLFACLVVSVLMSDQGVINLAHNFLFVTIAVFSVIINLLFFCRYEAASLIASKFEEPGIKGNFPKVIFYLAISSLALLVMGNVHVFG